MRERINTLFFIFIMIYITSCTSANIPQSDNPDNEVDLVPSAYPASTPESQSITNSYPGSEISTEIPIIVESVPYPGSETSTEVPTIVEPVELPLVLSIPDAGFANVGGVVIDEKTRQSPPESLLFLGEVIYTDKGLPIISIDRQNDPVVVLPPNGVFIFENIIPGEYGVVFFTPDYSFLMEDAETHDSMIITLLADDILDIGLHELPAR